MKKIVISTLAIAMMMTMAACSSSDNDVVEISGENQTGKKTFTAICENSVGTRAKLDSESGKKVLWEEGDKIGINGYEYTLESGAGSTKGIFTKTASFGPTQQTKFIAVYPYMAFTPTQEFDAINIPFPSQQNATEGTFDKDAALMVAYSDDGSNTLEFKNVGALVKVKLKFNCKKIVLNAGDESVALAGKGTLSYNGGNPTYTINSDKAYSITLSGDIKSDKTYYIAVPAVKLNAGWSISFVDKNDDNVYTRKGSKDIEFKRNYIIDLGEFYSSTAQTSWTSTIQRNGNVAASQQVDMGVFTIGTNQYRLIFTKSNLTATGLADDETKYGDYFAWGATEPWYTAITGTTVSAWKTDKNGGYTVSNAQFYTSGSLENGDLTYSKYNESNKELELNDDAAHCKLGGDWQIPTKDIWTAFIAGTNNNYYSTDHIGMRFTSNTNGNSIFLPCSGNFDGVVCKNVDVWGLYWSNTSYNSTNTYLLTINSSGVNKQNESESYEYESRFYGFTIRPVRLVDVTE